MMSYASDFISKWFSFTYNSRSFSCVTFVSSSRMTKTDILIQNTVIQDGIQDHLLIGGICSEFV